MKYKNFQIEFFNFHSNGLGIDWYKSDKFLLITISFIFVQVTIKI